MQITFYVLNSKPASAQTEQEAFLAFVCHLTETVLKKSKEVLIIVDDDLARLQRLDKQLWMFSNVSFIPHDVCIQVEANKPNKSIDDSKAPVILTDNLPTHFDGVVLNLATNPLNLSEPTDSSNTNDVTLDNSDRHRPNRLLEIIPADEENKEIGRKKYRHYQSLGYQLEVHKID